MKTAKLAGITCARLFAMALLPACGTAEPDIGPTVQIDTVADTIIVRNLGPAELGAVDLVPEVRIGTFDGRDEEMFGDIAGLAASPDGTIYVYDRQVPALRAYDADGNFLRTIGRKGGGPGEYENSDGGMAVLSSGRLVLRDPGNARFAAYRADGKPDGTWPGRGGFFTSTPLYVDRENRIYSTVFRPLDEAERGTTGRLFIERLLRMDADGTPIDTLDIPDFGYEPPTIVARNEGSTSMNHVPFMPAHSWSLRFDGSLVVGIGDRYAIFVFRPEGGMLRIEREAERVPTSSAEREDARERATARMRQVVPDWRWNGPPIPDTKPAFTRVFGAQDDRIWVLVPQPAERIEWTSEDQERARDPDEVPPARFREPIAFDVFEPDGRYLARVRTPQGFSTYPAPIFRDDHVWAVVRDELDVSYVMRLRIDFGEPEAAE